MYFSCVKDFFNPFLNLPVGTFGGRRVQRGARGLSALKKDLSGAVQIAEVAEVSESYTPLENQRIHSEMHNNIATADVLLLVVMLN